MIRKGDIVQVVNTESIFTAALGSFGVVTSEDNAYKAIVLLRGEVAGRKEGSLSHSAYPSDLKVIGRRL